MNYELRIENCKWNTQNLDAFFGKLLDQTFCFF